MGQGGNSCQKVKREMSTISPKTGEGTTGRPCREKESPSTRRFKWNETRKQIYIRSSMKLRGNREGERGKREREHNMAKQGTAQRGAVDGMGERSSVV